MELVSRVKQCYMVLLGTDTRAVNVTDTLATKILLGTLGCTPAYDRFFVEGLKKSGLSFPYLNARNFSALISYCQAYRQDFSHAQQYILAACGVDYPDMKVIDMYFWMLGADESME